MRVKLLIIVLALLVSRAAAAQTPESGGPSVQTESEWYGQPVLVVYGVGYSAVTLGLIAGSAKPQAIRAGATVLLFSGAGTMLLGVPIVHWSHDELGKGFISLGGQVGAFGTGSLIGYLAAGDDSKGTGALVGGAIGHATFALADAFLLAHHERVLSVETTTARYQLVPYGMGAALQGSF